MEQTGSVNFNFASKLLSENAPFSQKLFMKKNVTGDA
jgi:hypothetical protein